MSRRWRARPGDQQKWGDSQKSRNRAKPLIGDTRRISKRSAILREHFDEQLKMEEIVRELEPLQFQRHLHLPEARRLMLGEDMDAASAGFRVGYEDPSHFSRDYKRHLGRRHTTISRASEAALKLNVRIESQDENPPQTFTAQNIVAGLSA